MFKQKCRHKLLHLLHVLDVLMRRRVRVTIAQLRDNTVFEAFHLIHHVLCALWGAALIVNLGFNTPLPVWSRLHKLRPWIYTLRLSLDVQLRNRLMVLELSCMGEVRLLLDLAGFWILIAGDGEAVLWELICSLDVKGGRRTLDETFVRLGRAITVIKITGWHWILWILPFEFRLE